MLRPTHALRWIPIALATLALLFASTTLAQAHLTDYDTWLEWAELGPHQPEVEDWDAIYEAAQGEPTLTIYTATSRIHPSIERMLMEYPGLDIEAINIPAPEANERVRREWDAGLRNVGILHSGAPDFHYEVLLQERQAVTNYVPRELQAIMDPIEYEPMLRQRYFGGVWVYSTSIEDPDTTPWSNVWELTTDAWTDRIAIWDPLETDASREYFAALIAHADLMEELYEDHFGEPIELTTPNAGLEFMKRLLDNGLRIFSDHRDVAAAVTAAEGNFAGFTTSSAARLVMDGAADFRIDTDVSPSYRGYNTLLIGSLTPSPNTAKMVVRWLMSEDGGSEWWGPNFPPFSIGFGSPEPWLNLGDFAMMLELPLEGLKDLTDDVVDYWLLWR
jgi:iron(III) transport system substrate-binding protein